jgi:hypothetical protein
MASYENSKGPILGPDGVTPSGVYPENVVDSTWQDLEPLITAEQLRARQLWGIPLVSNFRDPTTGKQAVMGNDDLTDRIRRAVSLSETELKINIAPRQYVERLPLDRADYQSWGYFRLQNRPITSIEGLSIITADGVNIFNFDLRWIDTGNLIHGQINLVPYTTATLSSDGVNPPPSTASGYFLDVIGGRPWVPSYFTATYTAGFANMNLPVIINEYIACFAAIITLSDIAATYAKTNSASISMDGVSQSASSGGPMLFNTKIEQLTQIKDKLNRELKNMFAQTLMSGSI